MALLCLLGLLLSSAPAAETLIVGHKLADSIGFYDVETGKQLAVVRVGSKPHEMELADDHRQLYVTNYGVDRYTDPGPGGSTISIVDIMSRKKIADIDLKKARRPHGIVRGRSGFFYVTVDNPPAVVVINPDRRVVAHTYHIDQKNPHMLAVSADERKIWVANAGSASVSVYRVEIQEVRHIPVDGVPCSIVLNADETFAYVATGSGNSVSIIDTKQERVTDIIQIPGAPSRVKLTPDGRRLIVSNQEAGDIAAVDLRTLKVVARITAGKGAEGVTTDGDGHFGYVSAQDENKVIQFLIGDWKRTWAIPTAAGPDPLILVHEKR